MNGKYNADVQWKQHSNGAAAATIGRPMATHGEIFFGGTSLFINEFGHVWHGLLGPCPSQGCWVGNHARIHFYWTHRHGEILGKKKTVTLDDEMVPTLLDLIAPELSEIISNGLQVDLVTVDVSNDDGHEPVKPVFNYPQARLLFSLLEQTGLFASHRHQEL